MDQSESIISWINDIENEYNVENLITKLKEIFIKFKKQENKNVLLLQQKIIEKRNLTADRNILENIFKTYFRILVKMDQTDENFINEFQNFELSSKNLFIHAIFASEYYKLINKNDLFKFCFLTLKETSVAYTKFALGALRNMFQFCKNINDFLLPSMDIWKLIYLNLDLPFHGAREQCMILLDQIISRDFNFTLNLFDEVINFWTWTNKFKYYILSVIFSNYGFYKVLKDHQNLDVEYFLRGITISLKYKHLLSSSQSLVKSLIKQDVEDFNFIIIDVFKLGSDFEFQNCISQWMIHFQNLSILYNILDLRSLDFNQLTNEIDYLKSTNYSRLVFLRYLLKNSFEERPDIDDIDNFLLEKLNILDSNTKICLLEIYLHKLQSNPNLRNIASIKFVISNSFQTDCPALRNSFLKQISIMIDFLCKSYLSNLNSVDILNFFQYIKTDIYSQGIRDGSNYQSLIFSLKLYEILLKSFSGSLNDRLNKSTNFFINQKFQKVLVEEKIWDFYSENAFNEIFPLIENEFDDVRELATKILLNYSVKCDENTIRHKCIKMIEDQDTTKCSIGRLYCRLYINIHKFKIDKLNYFLLQLYSTLVVCYDNFQNDPLKSSKSGEHLFGYINCITEFYQNIDKNLVEKIICLLKRISNSMLMLLNVAGKENDSPDFETMDESLQMLVEKSSYKTTDAVCDRKQLLLSIWLTLKSCGDCASKIGIYLLTNVQNESSVISQARDCLAINISNLYKCRHKGVIEASGLSLGLLVNFITTNFKENHEIFNLLYECFPILFGYVENTSTTRRGAGFSIMLHHLVKNDVQQDRPILVHSMQLLLNNPTNGYNIKHCETTKLNCDTLEAAKLHYLCVLVKDASLREDIMPFMERIIEISFEKINSDEWKIRNAALQLFGAIIPKLLGQRQYFDENEIQWEPVHITLDEIIIKMPKLNQYILKTLEQNSKFYNSSSSSLILFLEFLSKTEIRRLAYNNNDINFSYNSIFWNLMSHKSEKIRILAGKCFVLFHEFRLGIPKALENIISILFSIENLNFQFSLINVIILMLKKYSNDIQFIEKNCKTLLFSQTKIFLMDSYKFSKIFSNYYLRIAYLNLFQYLEFNLHENAILEILFFEENFQIEKIGNIISDGKKDNFMACIGYDLWFDRIIEIYGKKT